MVKKLKKVYRKDGQDQLLPRLSLGVFNHPRKTALLWLCLTIAITIALGKPALLPLIAIAVIILEIAFGKLRRRSARA